MFSYFLVSLTYCGDKYVARGSTFGHILGRCRTVPRSIAIGQESLMRHLGIIKIPLHNRNYITKQSKNKQPKNKGSADRRAVQCVGLFFFYRTYQLEKTATPIEFPRSPNKSRTVWWYLVRIWVTTCQHRDCAQNPPTSLRSSVRPPPEFGMKQKNTYKTKFTKTTKPQTNQANTPCKQSRKKQTRTIEGDQIEARSMYLARE